MSYQADKPFGRRRTDKNLSPDETSHLQRIRRDVDEDTTGLIRRYLRLAKKVLEMENGSDSDGENIADSDEGKPSRGRAA
jgi:hypothetical protein